MKKIISSILSAAVLTAAMAMPALADYEEVLYDVEKYRITFDDGAATNEIDGSAAKEVTGTEVVFDASADTSIFTREFFWSFDVCYNSAEDGTIPGTISIEKKKSSGNLDKQGPLLSIKNGNLVTATGSSSTQTLGAMAPDQWYTVELEGKMVVSGASATFRLYSYEDGVKTLVKETTGMNLRQFYAGSSNGNPNCMKATNVSIDNILFISEYPDEIVISSMNDVTEIDAGTTLAMDYVAKRLGAEVTKHAITWTVCDEDGNELSDENVSITEEGILVAGIHAASQTVLVKATTEVGAESVTGEYAVTIKAVDTSDEKFDSITIDGPAEMKAGEQAGFTFTAMKGDEDVTEQISAEDVVWSIYNCDDLEPNNNKYMSIENGVVSVDNSVLAQDIYVRATSVSGAVYGSKALKINTSDAQVENILVGNACETGIDTAQRVESFDGSSAYLTTAATTFSVGNQTEYAVSAFDIKFVENGAGVRIKRNDGKENSSFVYRDGTISQQTGSNSYSLIASDISTDKWYYMEILYKAENASCNVYEYAEDGTKTLISTKYDINRRNGSQFGKLEVQNATYIDNVKITTAIPDEVTITSPGQYLFAGESLSYTATAKRNNLPLYGYTGFEWSVLDASDLVIIDGSITIDEAGILITDPMVKAQTVTIKVSVGSAYDTAQLIIQASEMFTVTNLGINEAGTEIVKLYFDKNFYYEDEVSFIIAIKDANGRLMSVKRIATFGDRLSIGSNELTTSLVLPTGFNPETDVIEAMVWTSL